MSAGAWIRRELPGWIFALVVGALACCAALEILGLVDLLKSRAADKRTATLCREIREEREKQR